MFTKHPFTANLRVLTYACLVGMLVLCGSPGNGSAKVASRPIVDKKAAAPVVAFVGTKAYRIQVASFRFTAKEAGKRALEYQRRKGEMVFGPRHCLVIGDDYVISYPLEKLRISLTGLYVNGKTGKLTRVETYKDVEKVSGGRFWYSSVPFRIAFKMGWNGRWLKVPDNSWGRAVRRE